MKQFLFEAPKGFSWWCGKKKYFLLVNSLLGLKQTSKAFHDKLSEVSIQREFAKPDHDHCLFMKEDMIYVNDVNDTIMTGSNAAKTDYLIKNLGISSYEENMCLSSIMKEKLVTSWVFKLRKLG